MPQAERAESSHGLRKELGVMSLVLTQLLFIPGASWIGMAATVGDSHVVLWLAAAATFFIPLGIIVANLANLMPVEGGIYRWAEAAFGPYIGFLAAWSVWGYAVGHLGEVGMQVASTVQYALQGHGGFSIDNPWHVRWTSILVILICGGTAALGLRLGKWVHDAGGILNVLAFGAVIAVPIIALSSGQLEHYHPITLTAPLMTLFSLNIMSKMAVGAFSGFEYVAIMAGECRNPRRSIVRSIWISTPIILGMFILGTSSMVALVPTTALNLIAPMSQTLQMGLGSSAFATLAVSLLLAIWPLKLIASTCFVYAGCTRLPMVAGWRGQAPAWLGKVNRRFGSPLHSVVLVAITALLLVLISQTGARAQEAYQLLDNTATMCYSIAYLILFSIPLVGRRSLRDRIPVWVRLMCVPGLLITAIATWLALVPIVAVGSSIHFAMKTLGMVVLVNLIGLAVLLYSRRVARNVI